MSILTFDKVTVIFCIADNFCKEMTKNEVKQFPDSSDGNCFASDEMQRIDKFVEQLKQETL